MKALEVVQIFVLIIQGYFALGAVFSVPLALFFLHHIDPTAREGTWGFRIFVIPGFILLWPLFLWRLVKKQTSPTESNAHRTFVATKKADKGD